MPDHTPRRILIVGGGIAGLALAAALRRRDVAPDVLDRAPAWAPIGAGIVLSANAMRALRAIGLAEGVAARGSPLLRAAILDARGRTLSEVDLAEVNRRYGGGVALHRGALHEALLAGCDPRSVRLGVVPTAIEARADEVCVRASDGSEGAYDLVVGADGIRSSVRDLAFGANPPRYAGYTCWRGVVKCPPGVDRQVEMWGRGRRFGLVPIGSGLLYFFSTLNTPPSVPDAPEGRLERFRACFAAFGGHVPEVLAQLALPDELLKNDLEEVVQGPWVRGRVVLVGDAAHASTPNMGQGAAMALEDAVVLADELAKRPLREALPAWVERRRRRALFIQTQSRRIGRLGQRQHPLACALRDFAVRALPDRLAARTLERLLAQEI